MQTVLYIHGFLSSPKSQKAQMVKAWLARHCKHVRYVCPSLSSYPSDALSVLEECVASCDSPPFVIGSSLGGFWASHLIENGLANKAVLVNPAVSPHIRFTDRVGVPLKSYYSDEVFTLKNTDLAVLGKCETPSVEKLDRYWVMLQTGDEVLDYRMAEERYSGAKMLIEKGGDHGFTDFESHIESIMGFFSI